MTLLWARVLNLLIFLGIPILGTLFIIVWDIWMVAQYGVPYTISATMEWISQERPYYLFVIGFILGALVFGLASHFWARL